MQLARLCYCSLCYAISTSNFFCRSLFFVLNFYFVISDHFTFITFDTSKQQYPTIIDMQY